MGCAVLSAGGAQGYCAITTALAAAECQLVLGQVTRQLALAEPKASAARAAGLADAKEKATVAYTTYAGLVGKRAKRGMAHCHRLLGRLREDDKVPCREQSDAGVSPPSPCAVSYGRTLLGLAKSGRRHWHCISRTMTLCWKRRRYVERLLGGLEQH